jgi:hypothetical protein
MEFNKPFCLPADLRAVTSVAADDNHRMLPLRLGESPIVVAVPGCGHKDVDWQSLLEGTERAHYERQSLPQRTWAVRANLCRANNGAGLQASLVSK